MGGASSRKKMDQSSGILFFNQQDLNRLESSYQSGGLEAIIPLIQEKVTDLKNVELHIAVTGESGTGKSSFINSMRELIVTDEGAAEVGSTETTMEPTKYQHPSFPGVYLWDLPGVGTTKFPAKEYLNKMQFGRYDFFILVAGERFRENDATLAKEVKNLGKKLYFVRSKIDNVFHIGIVDKERELDKIRNYCADSLRQAGISQPQVFLITSYNVTEFDFPALKETLANNLDDIKRDLFLQSLPITTLKIVGQKQNQLKSRIWMLATTSGAIGAVPIPGLSFACDLGILVTAIIQFRTCLGLDDASLYRLAKIAGKPVEDLKAVVKTPLMGEVNTDLVKRFLMGSTFVGISAAEIALDFVPVIGSIFGAASSFAMTFKLLNNALDELVGNAQRVVKTAFVID